MLLKLDRLRSFTKSMKSLKSMQINASLLYCSEPRIIEPKNTLEEHLEKEKKNGMGNQDMFRTTGVSEMHEKVLEPDSRNDIENKSFHERPRFGRRNNFKGPGRRSFVMFDQKNNFKEDDSSTKQNSARARGSLLQNEPQTTCEKRREVQEEILNGRKKLREMLDILDKTSVGDDAKTSVVQQVGKLLGEQESLHFSFMLLVQDERDEMTRSVSKERYNMDREDHKIRMDVGRFVPLACVALLILFVLA